MSLLLFFRNHGTVGVPAVTPVYKPFAIAGIRRAKGVTVTTNIVKQKGVRTV